MMIPKIIHYVWVGGAEIPENLKAYMRTWVEKMPGWQIMRWTEETIAALCAAHNMQSPIFNIQYCREAYEAKKYAFVSDYVRLWVLEQYGGVYMDTDVEVVRPFDELDAFSDEQLAISAFIGFEESLAQLPGTCVMGCEAHCQWIRDMLATYEGAVFRRESRDESPVEYDMTTNVQRMGKVMVEKYGLVPDGKEQMLEYSVSESVRERQESRVERLHVYDHHHFSPITSTRVMRKSKDTYAIHHFAASWHDQKGLVAKLQASPVVCELLNAMILVKRGLRKVMKGLKG